MMASKNLLLLLLMALNNLVWLLLMVLKNLLLLLLVVLKNLLLLMMELNNLLLLLLMMALKNLLLLLLMMTSKNLLLRSSCCSVGREVASDTRGLRFESSRRQKFISKEHLFSVNSVLKRRK